MHKYNLVSTIHSVLVKCITVYYCVNNITYKSVKNKLVSTQYVPGRMSLNRKYTMNSMTQYYMFYP